MTTITAADNKEINDWPPTVKSTDDGTTQGGNGLYGPTLTHPHSVVITAATCSDSVYCQVGFNSSVCFWSCVVVNTITLEPFELSSLNFYGSKMGLRRVQKWMHSDSGLFRISVRRGGGRCRSQWKWNEVEWAGPSPEKQSLFVSKMITYRLLLVQNVSISFE